MWVFVSSFSRGSVSGVLFGCVVGVLCLIGYMVLIILIKTSIRLGGLVGYNKNSAVVLLLFNAPPAQVNI